MPARPPETAPRPILTAELIAVGTELTVGETLDTNSGELARSLVERGVRVDRIANLPDTRPVVVEAIRAALDRVDLVVTTGGLGPTPDDLTREAVADACGEPLEVDPDTLAWLHERWRRRHLPFPETNIKQAWLIPSATSLPNPHGSAPGWWVDRPDERVIVLLPGPPREMRPMWTTEVLPRLTARGAGADTEVRTLRLTGIGESQLAADLGEALLRADNPIVATYARNEAVDIRISARGANARSAAELADEAERAVMAVVGDHVWARGDMSWSSALGAALAARRWTLATVERGSSGALVRLLSELAVLRRAEVLPNADEPVDDSAEAERVRQSGGADVGLAIRVAPAGEDSAVRVGIAWPGGAQTDRRLAFMRGSQGADRAAIAAASVLLTLLREPR